jgi:UDP-N-acetyl-D-mannosaminuronic acid dehydrogenase
MVPMSLPETFSDHKVCILGLGYVGLTLAVAMADTGFKVHGIEIRGDVLEMLSRGEPHFWEPRLKQKLQRAIANDHLSFSQDTPTDLEASVFFITVGTPLGRDGKARFDMVAQATQQLTSAMRDGALVILRSTVQLGAARRIVKPILEKTGRKFMLAMCPERTLEGRALIELRELPQIIGADDAETRHRCQQIFGKLTPTTLALSSLEAAEMVKLVDNTYRDVSFAFANEVAKLCGAMGLSAREVIRAGKLGYPRNNVALPGPVGGPCLEKDPHILIQAGGTYDVDMAIARAARATNEEQPMATAKMVAKRASKLEGFPAAPRIAILGLAFKGVPATDDLRGTMAKPILAAMRNEFPTAKFIGYDAVVAAENAKTHLGLECQPTLEAAFDRANIVVIANNHPIFQSMDLSSMMERMARPSIVYDYWNLFDDIVQTSPDRLYLVLGGEGHGT